MSERDNKILENANAIDPQYYRTGGIETIDFIEAKELGFCLGNAVKYISRAGKKNPEKETEDLNKAIWYIQRRIKEIESETESFYMNNKDLPNVEWKR